MRRAFVIGSNGPADLGPLRFAHQDAERIKTCLSGGRCGFEVSVPEQGTEAFEVRRQLFSVAESCATSDTFVCYFSGHGVLEKGALVLLWENTRLDRLLTTALPVADILQAFYYCKARSKLLILDCCHAGAAVELPGSKDNVGVPIQEIEIQPDNYMILMASDRLEMAREVESLQGSFLSTSIASALDDKFDEADKDHDGRLSVQDLKQWLEERARLHNQLYPNSRVPYPYLFGKHKGNFFLTVRASDWIPFDIEWPDGTTMVVLPIRPSSIGVILCIGKYPVTNAQYKRFVEATQGSEPVGKHFHFTPDQERKGFWQGPFYPWREEKFLDPNKPVVCVSYEDALRYCQWIKESLSAPGITTLPTPQVWDLAAFGTAYPSHNPEKVLMRGQQIHHKSLAPASIDRSGARTNSWGLSDMFGNVWEWCDSNEEFYEYQEPLRYEDSSFRPRLKIELRGGSFLEDLSRVAPFVYAYGLENGPDTRHSDTGFRIAASLFVEDPNLIFPEELRQRLAFCKPLRARVDDCLPAIRLEPVRSRRAS